MAEPNIKVSASIMCIDWLNAGRDLAVLETKNIHYLHFDIIDGGFAPDFTMGSSIINEFRAKSKLPSDYHLMVQEPSRVFSAFQVKPGDIYSIHQEASPNLHRDLVSIRRMGARVGVAISPGTPIETLEYVIEECDVVLLMMVDPGYKGQPIIPQMFRKIEKLRKMIDDLGLKCEIEVDGNVSPQNVADMVSAGADILVGGSSGLFRKDVDLASACDFLWDSIRKGWETRQQNPAKMKKAG